MNRTSWFFMACWMSVAGVACGGAPTAEEGDEAVGTVESGASQAAPWDRFERPPTTCAGPYCIVDGEIRDRGSVRNPRRETNWETHEGGGRGGRGRGGRGRGGHHGD